MKIITKYRVFNAVIFTCSFLAIFGLYNLKEFRIKDMLDYELNINQIKYDSTYKFYKILAYNTKEYLVDSKETMKILKKLKDAKPEDMNLIRTELYEHLKSNYKNLQQIDFQQFHFHLNNNHSFLRLHQPEKYGDDLTDIRYGVKLSNQTLEPVDGFENGKLISGMRYIFPIIDDEKNHLGSVEITVETKKFIKRMRSDFLDDIHFLLDKKMVNLKLDKQEIQQFYKDSTESKLYYVNTKDSDEEKNSHKKMDISKYIENNKPFSIYHNHKIISFLPIKNIEGKKVAYIVVYTHNETIEKAIFVYWILNILNILITFILFYIHRKNYYYVLFETKVNNNLQYHRNILETIIYIQNEFVTNNKFNDSVENSLKEIIKILNIDRVYIFENHMIDNKLACSQRFEFVNNNVSAEIDNPKLQNIPYVESGLIRWKELFENHKYIDGLVKDFSGYEKEILESQDIKSILVMPVWFENEFWGFMGFDDCHNERVWGDLEKDILKTLCSVFITALNKKKYSDNLNEQVHKQLKDIRTKDEQLLQQSKLAQMGDMISMIAHQWRQPLNAISASSINLSLLSTMGMLEDSKVQEDSEFIQNQCQKMSGTIETFMNFVKPSKESSLFKFKHTFDSIINIMGVQLKNHNIVVNIEYQDENLSMVGHEDLLEQVIINILSNARDAFEELSIDNKIINIKVDSEDDIVLISIEDNANGVPKEIADKIFNPYFTTKEQGKGTGLGLYMSKDIMQKSFCGELKLDILEHGSRFTLICGALK